MDGADAATTGRADRHPADGWPLAPPRRIGRLRRAALHGLIAAIVPPEPAPQVAPEVIEHGVRTLMRYAPWIVAMGFWTAVVLLDQAPRWRGRSWRPLRRLDRALATEVLFDVDHRGGVGRELLIAVRGAIQAVYYDQDEVHAAFGYDPRAWIRGRIAVRDAL